MLRYLCDSNPHIEPVNNGWTWSLLKVSFNGKRGKEEWEMFGGIQKEEYLIYFESLLASTKAPFFTLTKKLYIANLVLALHHMQLSQTLFFLKQLSRK